MLGVAAGSLGDFSPGALRDWEELGSPPMQSA